MTRQSKSQPPMLVDNSLNRALSVKYAIYALFGLSGVVFTIPSFELIAGEIAAITLAGIVCVSGVFASIATWNYLKGGQWPKRELYATIVLVVFVACYDIALIYLAAMGEGNRVSLAIIATALLVMPYWRIRFLLRKSRNK